jgi:hypothetical protein
VVEQQLTYMCTRWIKLKSILQAHGTAPYATTHYQSPVSDDRLRMRILHVLEIKLGVACGVLYRFVRRVPTGRKMTMEDRRAVSARHDLRRYC